jgi:16S rRNA (guanine527-N7)-methyltransferase
MTPDQVQAAVAAARLSPLPANLAERFADYLHLLLKWNAKLNLTAIRDPETILQRHFVECIFLAQQLPDGIGSLLDFGSGGGFPGVPIALYRPEIQVTLGESQSKKAAFLREAVRTLNIKTNVFQGRIETLQQRFDAVALRAVDKMPEAIAVAQTKVLPGGWLILFATEVSAPSQMAGLENWNWQSPLHIPGSSQEILLFGQAPSVFHVEQL